MKASHGDVYWHGGAPKLDVGDLLEPGHASPGALQRYMGNSADYRHGVYLTTDREFARSWAATWAERHGRAGDGTLYRVRPLNGVLDEDPDFRNLNVSWRTDTAVIEAVEEKAVRLTPKQTNERRLRYATWADGSPRYDSDGYSTVGPEMSESLPLELLRMLPPWSDLDRPETQALIVKLDKSRKRSD